MIGIIATILTTSSILPQLYKTYVSKQANNLSLIQMIGLWVGILCWLFYGIEINCITVIVANSISLFFQTLLIGMKFQYTNRDEIGL